MPKDTIFSNKKPVKDFSFDTKVANVFDDMVVRSVPYYIELQRMIGEMAARFYQKKTMVYDFGCSTGTTLISLMTSISDPSARFVGVDNSQPMIEKAKQNIGKFAKKRNTAFVCADLNKPALKLSKISVSTMNWTLQFVRPIYREALLKQIWSGTVPGGVLMLCEKILAEPTELNRLYIDLYYNFKKRNGYSQLEIAQKREALENVLLPCTVSENTELLRAAGFAHVDTFFRWYNWAGIIAIK